MVAAITLPRPELIAKNILGMFQMLQVNNEGQIPFDSYWLSVTNLVLLKVGI